MRIAIDARPLNWPGIGRYIRELTSQLVNLESGCEFHVYLNHEDQARLFTCSPQAFRVTLVRSKVHSLAEQVELPKLLQHEKIDLFHSPSSLVAPVWVPSPMVLTVHDMLFKARPEFLSGVVARGYFNFIHNRSVAQAARIITVSNSTRNELGRFHPASRSKSQTVYNGIAHHFNGQTDLIAAAEFRQKAGIKHPYFLAVGSLKRHKNFATLLHGFAELKTRTAEPVQLVILAKRELRNPDQSIAELVERLPIANQVTFIDNLSEAQLAAAYAGAEAFITTSCYEGFGLPVAEAMACNTPVIVSDIEVFHEVTLDQAIFVDPCSSASVAEGMQQALADKPLARNLAAAALASSRRFSWRAAAEQTLAVYRDALEI